MRIRIGLSQAPRELDLEVPDADQVVGEIEKAMAGNGSLVWITDQKGRRHGLVADKIAFIELEADEEHDGVGFRG